MREAKGKPSPKGSIFSGFVLDPEKCRKLSLGEKIELVHEIAKWPRDAPEILSSFTRRELLEIICTEMGKERKYPGYTKQRMIEHLLKLISERSSRCDAHSFYSFSQLKTETGNKRKRGNEPPVEPMTDASSLPQRSNTEKTEGPKICQNVACRASLCLDDTFCKRCSCCICHQFDDNKDPTLWLTCSSDSGVDNKSCGASCHLTCALTDERTGIIQNSSCGKLDGSFRCVSCGRINGLMRTWKKQLLIAKEARRVDVLCLRISLAQKIIQGSKKYEALQKKVDMALQALKDEVGPVDLLCTKITRGIVSRLSCSVVVQNLCASAVEALDSLEQNPCTDDEDEPAHTDMKSDNSGCLQKKSKPATCNIEVEELSATSIVISLTYEHDLLEDFAGCRIWHRKSTENYQENPTLIVPRPQKKFRITDLSPSTEYFLKVSLFGSNGGYGFWETRCVSLASSEPDTVEDDSRMTSPIHLQPKKSNSRKAKLASGKQAKRFPYVDDATKPKNEAPQSPLAATISSSTPASPFPCTPCKINEPKVASGSTCKKRPEENDYEFSVRFVKWLEHEGHIESEFRVKLLTWFSLKATDHQRRVVCVFVNTLMDDPAGLAEQLNHAFADEIFCEQQQPSRNDFFIRLWHLKNM